ncbi:Hypothetical predicted protein [Octopus vulgaris]|uniref:Uncharacterized protein n=1 Tax=Octopus vulgaris TaxID=6645 RepID=A0AA36C246_OCTVU|nr:Hypothetical predicted protein [Octopus vulgaris]
MGLLMFSCMIALWFYFTRAEKYKIIQSENVVLGGSARLSIYIPNMKRPVVWKCGNYKYECDRTCANGHDYTVTHNGNHSVLWIRKVTKECLTWRFGDGNHNFGKIHLKINKNVVLGGSATLSIYIPNMKRPVVWKCENYKYECDRTCANGTEYKVTHNGNYSVLWIRKVTKECLTWMFVDDNINFGIIHLKIDNLTISENYKIFQRGPAELGGNTTLHIEVPNMERIIGWRNRHYNLECDWSCYKDGKYEVSHTNNASTLSIQNITENDLSWTFCDRNYCSPEFSLELKADGSGTSIPTYAVVIISVLCLVAILIICCVRFKCPPYIWFRNRVNEWISYNEYQLPPVEV